MRGLEVDGHSAKGGHGIDDKGHAVLVRHLTHRSDVVDDTAGGLRVHAHCVREVPVLVSRQHAVDLGHVGLTVLRVLEKLEVDALRFTHVADANTVGAVGDDEDFFAAGNGGGDCPLDSEGAAALHGNGDEIAGGDACNLKEATGYLCMCVSVCVCVCV